VRSPKKFNVHLYQKVLFILACFEASAAPRPETQTRTKKMHFLALIDKYVTILVLTASGLFSYKILPSRQKQMKQNKNQF
jgi:hypothetical protein